MAVVSNRVVGKFCRPMAAWLLASALGAVGCGSGATPYRDGPPLAAPVTRTVVGRWPTGRERVVHLLQDDIQIGEEHYREDGLLQRRAQVVGRLAQWQELDERGRVRKEWQTLVGLKHGNEIVRDENGEVQALIHWKKGLRDGLTQWYTGGHKLAEQRFVHGVPEGPLVGFWPSGERRSEVQTVEDRRDGLETRWFRSGNKMAEVNWRLGVLHGPYRWFDEQAGYLVSEVRYEDGLPASPLRTFYPSGQERMVVPLLSPRPSEGPDAEPRRHGLARVFAEDGSLLAELPYTRDVVEGTEKRFAPDGTRTLEQEHCAGKPCRMLRVYYPSGRLMMRQLWRNEAYDGVEERFADDELPEGALALAPDVPSPLILRVPLRAGKKHGEGLVYGSGADGPLGRLLARLPFEDDLRHGTEVRLFPNGKKQAEYPWVRGKLLGMVWTWHENGVPESVYPVDGDAGGTGLERRWDRQGQLRFEVPLEAGKKQGIGKVFGPDGRLEATLTFRDGEQDGPEVRHRKSGKATFLWRKGVVVSDPDADAQPAGARTGAGVADAKRAAAQAALEEHPDGPREPKAPLGPETGKDGFIRTWYDAERSRLQSIRPARGNGVERHLHANGEQRLEVPIVAGQRHGLARVCDETGALVATVPYVHGARHGELTHYGKNGERLEAYPFANGQPTGIARKWFAGGRRQTEYTHNPKEAQGKELIWHPSGQLRSVVPLRFGKRHGVMVVFDEDGRRWAEQTWVEGQQHGPERRFSPTGEVLQVLQWRHGQQVDAQQSPPRP